MNIMTKLLFSTLLISVSAAATANVDCEEALHSAVLDQQAALNQQLYISIAEQAVKTIYKTGLELSLAVESEPQLLAQQITKKQTEILQGQQETETN